MERHILIIGGTGMLADASVALAARTRAITLVARTDRSLERLAARLSDNEVAIHRLRLDWTQPERFLSALRMHFRKAGPPSLTVAWLHDDELGPQIAQTVGQLGAPSRFVQVVGSQAADPAKSGNARKISTLENVRLQRVILGFQLAEGASRWLSHREICSGVLAAIESDQDETVVGTIRPWSTRP